jgi:predicted nucleic acid-binding protein
MARNILVDSGYLVALLSRRDSLHGWAAGQPERFPPPWTTCEAVLSETFHLLGRRGGRSLATLLERRAVVPGFDLGDEIEPVLNLLRKYADVPMSLADACLVRMSETLADPVIITTDTDFRVYRRHSRQIVPCVLPS